MECVLRCKCNSTFIIKEAGNVFYTDRKPNCECTEEKMIEEMSDMMSPVWKDAGGSKLLFVTEIEKRGYERGWWRTKH